VGSRRNSNTEASGNGKATEPSGPAACLRIHLDGDLRRLLELLPETATGPVAGAKLQAFWGDFASIEFRPLLTLGRSWSHNDFSVLGKVRRRALSATHPFIFALKALSDQKLWREPLRLRASDDLREEQWNSLMAVQQLLGAPEEGLQRPCGFERDLAGGEIAARHELFLRYARSFHFVAAALWHSEERWSGRTLRQAELEEACREEVELLIALQAMVPTAWRPRESPMAVD